MGNPNLKRHSPRGLVNHGPGKGDKSRHKLDDNWRDNYDAIDWHRDDPFVRFLCDDRSCPVCSKYFVDFDNAGIDKQPL